MTWLDNLKESLFQSVEKVGDVTEKLVEKGKKVGSESVEASREIFTVISERAADVTELAKLKIELTSLPKQLEEEYKQLGKAVVAAYREGMMSASDAPFLDQFHRIEKLAERLRTKQNEYEGLKKKHSSDYVVNKLSEDLSAANAVIDQVMVTKTSEVVGKVLKDISLPKEALISAIKREEEVIIPDGRTLLKEGDQVIIIGKKEDVDIVVKMLGR